MSRITISRANYKFAYYEQTPVKLTAYTGNYNRKLYKEIIINHL